jgi:hypothetical protein
LGDALGEPNSLFLGKLATSEKKNEVVFVGVLGVRGAVPARGVFIADPKPKPPPGENSPFAVGDCSHASTFDASKDPAGRSPFPKSRAKSVGVATTRSRSKSLAAAAAAAFSSWVKKGFEVSSFLLSALLFGMAAFFLSSPASKVGTDDSPVTLLLLGGGGEGDRNIPLGVSLASCNDGKL